MRKLDHDVIGQLAVPRVSMRLCVSLSISVSPCLSECLSTRLCLAVCLSVSLLRPLFLRVTISVFLLCVSVSLRVCVFVSVCQ